MGRAQALSRWFVQRMTDDAAGLGLVGFRPDPAHKKSSLIALGEKGRAAITAVLDREGAELREARADFADDEIAACIRALSRLLHCLDDADVN
ncbi:hypothetical protein [Streptomyces sp. NPDC018045]|uniref:hypothetical protein n=1 Tax=Streptomyces sp. NPDC018045 TaxID=3365037 RepID=UPI0037901203